MKQNQEFTVSVAPMMDWTDRHCRWFHRQLSSHVLLYTEMVVADAIIHGPKDRLLGFHADEHPVALQIGGSDPVKLAQASKIGQDYGYDEININIGCPSDRVQSGRFGACLMQEPDLVADCYKSMQEAVSIPVTVKCRLGVDDQELEKTLPDFLEKVSKVGCKHFIIHARKAWLKGLSPKENRSVPPIDYDLVAKMKKTFPNLKIVLNGQLNDVGKAIETCKAGDLDGFMLGRAAYNMPWILTEIDPLVYNVKPSSITRQDIASRLIDYVSIIEDEDRTAKSLIRHVMGLYGGQVGARIWRRTLSEGLAAKHKPSDILQAGVSVMQNLRSAA